MGFDYKLVKAFCDEKGIVLDIKAAPNLERLIELLDSGKVDLAAYEIPITAEYKRLVHSCGPVSVNSQVLVQPKSEEGLITDVTQLVGKDVYVERNSKYMFRLENLNEELGGGINIHSVNNDTIITEDLIQMVSDGEIPLTIVDSDIARLNKTYYRNLDITLPISFPQRSAWGVKKEKSWLGDSIDAWLNLDKPKKEYAWLLKRYFELSKNENGHNYSISLSGGRISQYDAIFKCYAKEIDWDWRLIAAQGYVESRFDTTVVSWAGAKGIMQIMPSTARALGYNPTDIVSPEPNVKVAVELLRKLEKAFESKVPDRTERHKFVIAAYNSGAAHIYDAMAIAKKIGKNPLVWENNVADALLLKANPEFYNDTTVCRYGYFRARQTTTYVKDVYRIYDKCKSNIPL